MVTPVISKLRENLSNAVKASGNQPQTIMIDGVQKAVIVGIDTWKILNEEKSKGKALKSYWKDIKKLQLVSEDDKEANEDIPRTDWKKRLG